jgi:large subunit ribosomal protein L29
MAILRIKEIKNMGKAELKKKLDELKKELMKVSSQRATKANIENPGKIKEIRRTIAKILTQLKNSNK